MKIDIQKKVLSANEQAAADNAAFFRNRGILCINVISSPGSGKTTLLARTATEMKQQRIAVIEGDIKTDIDAQKIRATGVPAVQIETHGACHLNAAQVAAAARQLPTDAMDIIFIENVGNLVCPAAFDLGETAKVVLLSTAEGDDKPAKYPGTFAKAAVVIINKIDLLQMVDFDIDRVIADTARLNPHVKIIALSAKTGEGIQQWYDWLASCKR